MGAYRYAEGHQNQTAAPNANGFVKTRSETVNRQNKENVIPEKSVDNKKHLTIPENMSLNVIEKNRKRIKLKL